MTTTPTIARTLVVRIHAHVHTHRRMYFLILAVALFFVAMFLEHGKEITIAVIGRRLLDSFGDVFTDRSFSND